MNKLKKPPIKIQRIRFTQDGFDKLKQEQESLKQQRPAVVEDLKKARDLGDLSENGYYKASKQKLSFIDGQLRQISYQLKYALIMETNTSNTVSIGKTVTLSDGKKEMTYQIVGDLEANPSEGKISLLSPLGKAIGYKKLDEEVTLELPSGTKTYTITKLI